jgi:hypothetical protein
MKIMHGPVRNTDPSTTQGRFSIPDQLQSSWKGVAEKKWWGDEKRRGFLEKKVGQ